MHGRLLRLLTTLAGALLHPQWLIQGLGERDLASVCAEAECFMLDIGCASRRPLRFLPRQCHCYGLDYLPTAQEWYAPHPDLYGDAQHLPVADGAVTEIILLAVLEHLSDEDAALRKAWSVLALTGNLMLQVPFLYTLRCLPLGYHLVLRKP